MTSTIIDVSTKFGFGRARFSNIALAEALAATDAIDAANRLIPDGWPVGYEQEVYRVSGGHRISEHFDFDIQNIVPDFYSRPRKPSEKVHGRPPTELCLYSLWESGKDEGRALEKADIEYLAGRLGTEIRWRGMQTAVTPSGHQINFTEPADIAARLELFLDHFNMPVERSKMLQSAVDSYLNFLLIHPLRDGNGFVARALFQLYLNKHAGLAAPIFPIAPIYYESLDLFQFAYLDSSIKLNGDTLLRAFSKSIIILSGIAIELIGSDG